MLDQSLQNKRLVINLDEQIDLLQNRIDTLKGVKSKADEEIHKKAKKRMRMIMGFYLLQIFAM
jgi:chaperonin cofactor prefoldin